MDESEITLLARQGIYDKDNEVYAYELLFRDSNTSTSGINQQHGNEGDRATSTVVTQMFANLSLDQVVGNKLAFINFTRTHLLERMPTFLPKDRVVVEILEDIEIDQQLIQTVTELRQKGYKIALDDFEYADNYQPLVDLADIIKIDVLNQSYDEIRAKLEPLSNFKGLLLAEKIEDKTQFINCVNLGFTYFQGFYLNKPDPVKGQAITENKTYLLRLINELQDPNVSMQKIEDIIAMVPKLSYRMLRLANSVAAFTGKKIDSLLDAMNQLGLVQINNWVSLLLLSSLDDVPHDLIQMTVIRAKMCELLAEQEGYSNPHQAYTVGILSTLDAIMNQPLKELLAKIQLSEVLELALLNQSGPLGKILEKAIAYEQANFEEIEKFKTEYKELAENYLKALEYTNTVMCILD